MGTNIGFENFKYYNPTKILFGKGMLSNLSIEIEQYGSNILIVSGGGSVKKTGLYQAVMDELQKASKTVFKLEGVQSNPKLDTVYEGINICRENNIDFILAVGGGSVIDTAKSIAAGAKSDNDVWEYFLRRRQVESALPIGVVLTLAATGSEMNNTAVLTNLETQDKFSLHSDYLFPRFSILDPINTFTVPKNQTINGCVDIMAHIFEQYFSKTKDTPLQDRFCEGILKTVIDDTRKVIQQPDNYAARANIMWSGTLALNGSIGLGKVQDWGCHRIGHALSAVYDIPHGASLAIVFPNWMRYVLDEGINNFVQYAVRVWDISQDGKTEREIAFEGINKTGEFFKEIGAPTSLQDAGISNPDIDVLVEKAMVFGPFGNFKKLHEADVEKILRMSL